ncbi:hypothetical protein AB0395_03460 [Streptosporangium sp. NPDC051023]|uniref:hypothetical protein n=1 Tax=Streptosporangium sp. NPDC051023 TaxID=3155410 RepID=UPI00344C24E5
MSTGTWFERLAGAEEHLIPADLRRAAEFLWSARKQGEGWGDYPGVPANLQVTAQVIGALQTLRHPKIGELVTSVAAWAHKHYAEQPPTTVQDAVGLLILATADQDIDGRYPDELRSALHAALEHVDGDRVSTLTLIQAVLAAEPWPDEHRARARPWVDELVRRGQGADGWHRTGLPEESLPVTSLAVRALAPWRHDRAVKRVVQPGLDHLRSHLLRDGWASAALSGTYALTLVLRALATDADREPGLFEEGLDLLRSRQRSDGGWTGGEREHGSSGVEHTAAAVTALAEAGACRYVPLLAARPVIRELTTSLDEVTRRQVALEEDVERQVEERLGRAITERRQLRRRLQEREAELRHLHRLVDEKESPSGTVSVKDSPSVRGREVRWLLLGVTFLGSSSFVVNLLARDQTASVLGSVLPAVITGLTAGTAAASTFLLRRVANRAKPESPGTREVRRLVDVFMDVTGELSPSVREELVYRLAREGADLPPELFLRFLTELTIKLHIDRETNRRLRPWMETFAKMEPQDRQVLIVQLRQAIL